MSIPFRKLNEAQKKAVTVNGQRVLILAGPGTGKTEVLGHRIRYLIKKRKVNPSEILAITFTMKAAQEMRDRLRQFSKLDCSDMRILTIHGECWRNLCQNLSDRISIADDDEKMMVLWDAIEDLGPKKSGKDLKKIKRKIELSKADNKLPEDLDNPADEFCQIFQEYENLMCFNKAIDFDGIITGLNRLFYEAEILRECRLKSKYLLVDEYQDINQAQFEFIRSLCYSDSELFCVGDDDQSIYGWRGAKPDFILNFTNDFPQGQELPLEETHRCDENILTAALNLISKIPNNKRKSKTICSCRKDGNPVFIIRSSSESQEAKWIANWICENVENKRLKPNDIAILCRDIDLASYAVSELRNRNIPVEYWKEGALFKDPWVKDIIAHLRVIVNPKTNNLALRRCLLSKSIKHIGEKRVNEIRKQSQKQHKPIWKILLSFKNLHNCQKWQKSIKEFIEWIEELIKRSNDKNVSVLLNEVLERINPPEDNKNVQKLKNLSQNLANVSVTQFLDDFWIKRRLDFAEGGAEAEDDKCAVAVMSMHSSKGLTYKVIFILGMEEGIFPRNNSNVDDEERRLCYVAMTRAKQNLFLCTAKRRTGRPAHGFRIYKNSSVFLTDILPCNVQKIPNYKNK